MIGLRWFRVYAALVAASVRGQLQYPASFLMLAFGQLVITGLEFLGILLFFARFGGLKGWSLPEIAMLYGMVNASFASAEAASAGFDRFGDLVKAGEFDRVLLRPLPAALQMAGYELTVRRVGRLAQGLALLGWGLWNVEPRPAPLGYLLIAAGLASGMAMFYGLIVLQATLAFWTTETLEIMNTLTYGGVETAEYPIEIYQPWFRKFFTYVVPLGAANYFPVVAALGRADPLGTSRTFQCLSPLLGFMFLGLSLAAWRVGVRQYTSAGS